MVSHSSWWSQAWFFILKEHSASLYQANKQPLWKVIAVRGRFTHQPFLPMSLRTSLKLPSASQHIHIQPPVQKITESGVC